MPRLLRATVLLLALSFSTAAAADTAQDQRAQNAVRVLKEIQAIPESAIPDKLFDEARGIVVIPDSLKIGLVIGGHSGHGLMSVRTPDGVWSNPVFVQLTGGSIGFQAGVQSSDIVLMFTGQRGLDSIVNGKITLGADASIAAGPVGRSTSMATDGQLEAEIWSWSRARGLFAGVALEGAVLSIDDKANQAVYGQGTTPRMIFEDRTAQRPSSAIVSFVDTLEEATAAARAARGTTGGPTPAIAPAVVPPVPTSTVPATTPPAQPAPMPQPFEPVDSSAPTPSPAEGPVRVEPLPAPPPTP